MEWICNCVYLVIDLDLAVLPMHNLVEHFQVRFMGYLYNKGLFFSRSTAILQAAIA